MRRGCGRLEEGHVQLEGCHRPLQSYPVAPDGLGGDCLEGGSLVGVDDCRLNLTGAALDRSCLGTLVDLPDSVPVCYLRDIADEIAADLKRRDWKRSCSDEVQWPLYRCDHIYPYQIEFELRACDSRFLAKIELVLRPAKSSLRTTCMQACRCVLDSFKSTGYYFHCFYCRLGSSSATTLPLRLQPLTSRLHSHLAIWTIHTTIHLTKATSLRREEEEEVACR